MTGLRFRPALALTALFVCCAAKSFSQPAITSLSPSSVTAGAPAFTLTVNGSAFASDAVVRWNGAPLATTFVSATQLTAPIAASLIVAAGSASVTVLSAGITTNASPFTIAAAPAITSLSPNSAIAGGAAFTLTVNGSGFVSGAAVRWNGTALTSTFVSTSQLTAAVPATLIAAAGTATVTVLSGGVASNGLSFTIASPPAITSLSPNSAIAGAAAFTLTVNGSSFAAGAVVRWNGAALATTFVSASQLTAPVSASLIAAEGTVTVTVFSSGVTSNNALFPITAAPHITALSPSSTTAGAAAFTLTVNGSGFAAGATVQWNAITLPTTVVSASQLTATVSAALIANPGAVGITAISGGGTSNSAVFTINPPPAITNLNPSSATAGGAAFTLTVTGSGFAAGAVVQWNGSPLSTTVVNAGQLTASVSPDLIASQGSATITVLSGVTSNGVAFSINAPPAISSLSPNAATASGAAFTLTVNGSGFLAGAVVQWNGAALPTTVQSASQLTAPVSAALIASAGTVSVTVRSGGVTSNGAQFTINPAPAITTLNPNSATAGGPAFTLAITGSGFATGAVAQWNGSALATTLVSATQLTAAVSATLIANAGTVNITVNSGGANSNAAPFVILNGPAISSLSPSVTTAGGAAFTLTVNGSGYTAGSIVNWNGSALPTSFVNPNALTASVTAALVAASGTASVTVSSGGVTSNPPAPFTIVPGPALNSLSPPATTAGGAAFTLTINGSGFGSDAVAQWNGTALATTFVNANQLTAPVSAGLIATAASIPITVVSGGVTSNALTLEVANGPALSALSPDGATAGGAPFTLTLTGTGFTSAATVQWNSTTLATTFVSATQLTAAVPANLIAAANTAQITVLIGGVSSNAVSFVVSVLTLSSLGPATGAASGQPFTLTVNGSGFNSSSVVEWNGTPLPTTFGNANQLTAAVPGNLSQNPGSAQVSVLSNGVLSTPIAFALVYPLSAITLGGLAATPVPTQPLSMTLKLASAAPTDLQGALTLSFVPNAAGVPTGYIDPALQFASGGITFSFAIKAATTAPTVAIPNIQQGTVAGRITVTLTSLAAGSLNVLPAAPLNASVVVPQIAPVVESCAMGAIAAGAFSVQLDAYSTPRDLASAVYTFTAASGAQITVTAANGGQVAGASQISVPVTSQLSQWFASSASQPNGSVFSLQAPFTLSGDASALQSVSVMLTNSIGASAQFACTR